MFHGDIVTLTTAGIVIHEKAVRPLGIFDKSRCWGVWAIDPRAPAQPNLIISPFHPRSWPFLIRLHIKLPNKKGSLAKAADLLAKNDLSILFAECITDGFVNATWHVIAESTREAIEALKDVKHQFDNNHRFVRINKDFDDAQAISNAIAAEMFLHVKDIEAVFNTTLAKGGEAHREDSKPLYQKAAVVEHMQKSEHYSPGFDCEAHLDRFEPAPITTHYLPRLAYFAMYGGGWDVPFSFQYHTNSALLRIEESRIFTELECKKIFNPEGDFHCDEKALSLLPLPRPAMATFDNVEKFLRIKPIKQPLLLNKLTLVNVQYEVEKITGEPQRLSAKDSQGLLARICDEFAKANVNLLHVSNKRSLFEYSTETGHISFIADLSAHRYAELKEKIGAINHRIELERSNEGKERISLKHAKLQNVDVYEYPQKKLFVSLHFGHPRDENIREITHGVALSLGFESTVIETHATPATWTVQNQISACDAFLQMLCFRENEDPEEASFSWLDFEYGLAFGKGLPTIRLVDTVRVPYSWWKGHITVNPDQRAKEFRSDVSDTDLTAKIRSAIEELANELARRENEN